MKLSSFPLIAAFLVAIAGSANATPSPLHTQTMAVDNLSKREDTLDHQKAHAYTAAALWKSAIANCGAGNAANATSQTPFIKKQQHWQGMADIHWKICKEHLHRALGHSNRALQESKDPIMYGQIEEDRARARWGKAVAKQTTDSAIANSQRKFVRTHVTMYTFVPKTIHVHRSKELDSDFLTRVPISQETEPHGCSRTRRKQSGEGPSRHNRRTIR